MKVFINFVFTDVILICTKVVIVAGAMIFIPKVA